MESILPVYFFVLGIVLAVIVFVVLPGDESSSRKLAKVRVRVDENRRGRTVHEPPEEDFEKGPALVWLMVGGLLLLLVMSLSLQ